MHNEFELVYMIHQKDEYASEELFNKYRLLVNKLVNDTISSYPSLSFYREDIQQESYITLMELVNTYRDDQNASFKTFLYVCVLRKIKAMLRHYLSQKNLANIYAISLDDFISEDSNIYLAELNKNPDKLSEPEYRFNFDEAMKRFKNVYNNLSDKDRVVYDLSSSDVSYQEASKILSCSIKQYDNSIQRVRRKIKSAIYCD